jgi:hypothetical protein
MFERMKDEVVATLYRIAKDPKKGVRPFFKNPKMMISLREEHNKRISCSK